MNQRLSRLLRSPGPGRPRSAPSLIQSFNYAIEGIIHTVRTHRNMRLHFIAAIGVLVAGFAIGVSKLELIALLLAIAFVLIAEMINSAIEGTVDLATTTFDPMAKLAKDVAAGAVLIAAVNALAIGYLVFSGQIESRSTRLIDRIENAPVDLTVIALVVTVILVIVVKALTGRGTPLRGGLPSGHAAIAFAGWMAVSNIGGTHRFLISSVSFLLAALVAHTRVEAGIHSTLEVVSGGLLGSIVTLLLFQAFR